MLIMTFWRKAAALETALLTLPTDPLPSAELEKTVQTRGRNGSTQARTVAVAEPSSLQLVAKDRCPSCKGKTVSNSWISWERHEPGCPEAPMNESITARTRAECIMDALRPLFVVPIPREAAELLTANITTAFIRTENEMLQSFANELEKLAAVARDQGDVIAPALLTSAAKQYLPR